MGDKPRKIIEILDFDSKDYDAIFLVTEQVEKQTNGNNNKLIILSDKKYIARICNGWGNVVNGFKIICYSDGRNLFHIPLIDDDKMLIF